MNTNTTETGTFEKETQEAQIHTPETPEIEDSKKKTEEAQTHTPETPKIEDNKKKTEDALKSNNDTPVTKTSEKKKRKKKLVKSVFESEPQQSHAHASSSSKVEVKQSVFVFESAPLCESVAACSATRGLDKKDKQVKSVFESTPAVSNVQFRHGEARPHTANIPTVFESQPQDSKAEYRASDAMVRSSNKTVFEGGGRPSMAFASASKPIDMKKQEVCVHESVGTDIENIDSKNNKEDEAYTNQTTCEPVNSQSQDESPVKGAVNVSPTAAPESPPVPGGPHTPPSAAAAKRTAYENKPRQSVATARWNQSVQNAGGPNMFESNPKTSAALTSWKAPVSSNTSQSVFESVPKVSQAHASASKPLSESEYETETDDD